MLLNWNMLRWRLVSPLSDWEAGASGQCVPRLEPWNERVRSQTLCQTNHTCSNFVYLFNDLSVR